MGLDQYLEARRYVSGYAHSSEEERQMFRELVDTVGMSDVHDERSATVSVNVAYWRKANHIHNWFVQNVQSGEDDCGSYKVSRQRLAELGELCQRVAQSGDPDYAHRNLPTASGFFFGGTDYDEYYFEETELTARRLAEILEKVPDTTGLQSWDFYYSSSW